MAYPKVEAADQAENPNDPVFTDGGEEAVHDGRRCSTLNANNQKIMLAANRVKNELATYQPERDPDRYLRDVK